MRRVRQFTRPIKTLQVANVGRVVLAITLCAASAHFSAGSTTVAAALEERVRDLARPLSVEADLDQLLLAAASARVVLLGEATHGTREFYEWRSVITRRLIEEQGMKMVAVEGDWRPIREIDEYVRGKGKAEDAAAALRCIKRWPQWMWANEQFAELIEWIRDWNAGRAAEESVRVHGLDLYGYHDSIKEVENFFRRHWPDRLKKVLRHYGLLRQYRGDGQAYANDVLAGTRSGAADVHAVVELLRDPTLDTRDIADEELFAARQDAWVVERAEAFYRAMLEPGERSWNTRAEHMWLTLQRLLDRGGSEARAVVWAHNTHVGDARATDMATTGAINIGQLAREALGDEAVFIVGFATPRGEAIAGKSWGGRRRALPLPPARPESWDGVLQRSLGDDHWFLFDPAARDDPLMAEARPQRAVGVVYDPKNESRVNYTQTILPKRFDALLFISKSHAVIPLH